MSRQSVKVAVAPLSDIGLEVADRHQDLGGYPLPALLDQVSQLVIAGPVGHLGGVLQDFAQVVPGRVAACGSSAGGFESSDAVPVVEQSFGDLFRDSDVLEFSWPLHGAGLLEQSSPPSGRSGQSGSSPRRVGEVATSIQEPAVEGVEMPGWSQTVSGSASRGVVGAESAGTRRGVP